MVKDYNVNGRILRGEIERFGNVSWLYTFKQNDQTMQGRFYNKATGGESISGVVFVSHDKYKLEPFGSTLAANYDELKELLVDKEIQIVETTIEALSKFNNKLSKSNKEVLKSLKTIFSEYREISLQKVSKLSGHHYSKIRNNIEKLEHLRCIRINEIPEEKMMMIQKGSMFDETVSKLK